MLLAGVVPLLCPRCARRKLQEYSSRFSSLTCNEHRLTGLAVRCGSGPWSSAGPLPCSRRRVRRETATGVGESGLSFRLLTARLLFCQMLSEIL